MSLLNLPACPICYEKDSLVRQEMDRAGIPFTWYQCRECRSVLLWLGRDHWTYQKIGRDDKAYLLKQPLTVGMLQALIDLQDEGLEAPAQEVQPVPAEELDVAPELAVLAAHTVPAEELDTVPEPPPLDVLAVPTEARGAVPSEAGDAVPSEAGDAVPSKAGDAVPSKAGDAVPSKTGDATTAAPAPLPQESKGVSRWLILALAVVGLCFVCAVAGLLLGMPAIDSTMATVVARMGGTVAPQDTPLPSKPPPANTARATDTPPPLTDTPALPTDTPRPAASVTPVPSATPMPSATALLPTATPPATDTPPPADTATPMPSATAIPPTDTPVATNTPPPANTATPAPTATAIPPTAQPAETPSARVVIASVNRTAGWVDIKNAGSAAQYLAGWALVWEQTNQRCALGGVLQSRQTVRVWAEAKDISQGGINCGFDAPAWNSPNDPVVLYDAHGKEVDRK